MILAAERAQGRANKMEASMNVAKIFLAGAAACALLAGAAMADPVQVRNGRFEAPVSANQMSRVVILGEKIVEVRKLDDPEGPQIIVEASEATGDVFVGFDGDVTGKTFSVFFITNTGRTIQGVLVPAAIDGQTVQVQVDPATQGRMEQRPDRRAPYQETLTGLIRLMFNGESPEGVVRQVLNEKAGAAGPFAVRVSEIYDVAGLRGQVLELRNTTDTKQAVVGDTFFVPGVLAVAVSAETLAPQQVGRVFVVEEH
ncbi:MAG: hypothetical protein B7Y99_02570 [Caulobacterales bacterium 32-69-10]|nr:MAG: hypothetical protein B7Y99_02570 [Caulobacterales bacterium 32-69-10]